MASASLTAQRSAEVEQTTRLVVEHFPELCVRLMNQAPDNLDSREVLPPDKTFFQGEFKCA